ncbi:L,D-transpeptidase family protein [Xylophilus sp. GOD-11R]|uniref:L,D-transpeptidase family protein n=1 Tax=Xylophilus sp. GOD-11R TaxID=3089814 RepID=UPI00298C5EA2|nr:L,D-transpeptidase family protein [Xylophilus sp. GOD-11R]WPB58894.1 L,D-transpeptidase family protein [Xylophilus sp. GOD-11R]
MTTSASRAFLCLAYVAALIFAPPALAAKQGRERAAAHAPASAEMRRDGDAEARLIEIYRLIGVGDAGKALAQAERLVTDYPQFQLGQLVYGDLLTLRVRPVRMLGDLPDAEPRDAVALDALRLESAMRLKALRERPPAGNVPMQFAKLASSSKHAIAVDASRSRLYLFQNSPSGMTLVADYYISVGKSGIDKSIEGDMRTPLGVYYITGSLDPRTLKAFYGAGALPINYPNPLDTRQGKTGGGIWLHGTPADQFSRPPLATDGCVVVANPDLRRILATVEPRSTPVVIAERLQWVPPQAATAASRAFETTFAAWRTAKTAGDMLGTMAFYAQDFASYGKSLADWSMVVQQDMARNGRRALQTKDLSILHWQSGNTNSMVVTFGEVAEGATTGPVRRQYWLQVQGLWKIIFEGTIG